MIIMDDLAISEVQAAALEELLQQQQEQQKQRYLRHRKRKSFQAFLTEDGGENFYLNLANPTSTAETAFTLKEFLSSRTHLNVEVLRQELKELRDQVVKSRSALVDLEYEALVNIAEDLIGLDQNLEDLLPQLLEMTREMEVIVL